MLGSSRSGDSTLNLASSPTSLRDPMGLPGPRGIKETVRAGPSSVPAGRRHHPAKNRSVPLFGGGRHPPPFRSTCSGQRTPWNLQTVGCAGTFLSIVHRTQTLKPIERLTTTAGQGVEANDYDRISESLGPPSCIQTQRRHCMSRPYRTVCPAEKPRMRGSGADC